MDDRNRALEIMNLLEDKYPKARIALLYENPLELLISTILSAQCTDKRVNEVTKTLFRKYRKPEDYANADIGELEQDIKSTGFYKNKAMNIKKCCLILIDRFNGRVPKTMAELITLPGVARKTANIVLSNAYGVIEGIAVDTHVKRLSKRLGLTNEKNPDKIEKDLMKTFPREDWPNINRLLILHGRETCQARKPKCNECILNNLCPSAFKV